MEVRLIFLPRWFLVLHDERDGPAVEISIPVSTFPKIY